MSKEQTLIEEFIESKGIPVRLGGVMPVTVCIEIIEELLTKEKEQREELIKEVVEKTAYEFGQMHRGLGREISDYYNEVIKGRY
jgi:hypothetical protein